MIRKKIAILFLLSSFVFTINCSNRCKCDPCTDDQYTGHSFMFTKPVTLTLPMKHAAWHNIVHHRHGDMQAAVQLVGFYQDSIPQKKTARYFLFDHKDCLIVRGDNDPHYKDRDIRAEWIGLPSDFSGGFTICPEQRQVGFFVELNQKIGKFFEDPSFFENMWFSLTIPFVAVENNINIRQFDIQNPGTGDGPRDILEAFNQEEWRNAKIGGKHSDVQMAYIKFMLGSTYMSDNNFEIAYYSQFLLSTAEGRCTEHIFDTFVGTNGHHGMGAGVNFQIVLNRDNDDRYDVCAFLDLEHLFLFRNKHYRTLDIKGKPWSRYMQFNQINRGSDLKLHGVNVLNREMRVRPYSFVDFTVGLRTKVHSLEVEIGYGIWGHGDEKLELVCPFPEIYGIAGTPDGDEPRTASASTIGNQADNDKDSEDNNIFVPIKTEDLCLLESVPGSRRSIHHCPITAAARSSINHRVHLALCKHHVGTKRDATFGAGAFYEIPQRNSSLKLWGLWAKVAASF